MGDSGLRLWARGVGHTAYAAARGCLASGHVWASVYRNEEGAEGHRTLSWGGVKGGSALSSCCGWLQASCSRPLGSSFPGSGFHVPSVLEAWRPHCLLPNSSSRENDDDGDNTPATVPSTARRGPGRPASQRVRNVRPRGDVCLTRATRWTSVGPAPRASSRATLESLPPHPLDQPCFPPGWRPLSPCLTPVPLPEGP